MKELRSGSQILFGFLPEQTVDLQGRIWKVKEWQNPLRCIVDPSTLRRELMRQVTPWAAANNDGKYLEDLFRGREVEIYTLNMDNGVRVEPFPEVWMCKKCKRVSSNSTKSCKCGARRWGQLPFVGYHDACGAIRAPYMPKCKEHKEAMIILPGTASASEIRLICPICQKVLRKGFGFPKCECGQGTMTYNVHRAASVYTPRTIVVVNPPSPERMRELIEVGGPSRALEWVLTGLETASFKESSLTKEAFKTQLVNQGIDASLAASLADQADAAGQFSAAGVDTSALTASATQEAEGEAVTIAMALAQSRIQIIDLVQKTDDWSELGLLYRTSYPRALARAGLTAVELVDRFPVLTGNFGYTRGPATPGASRLVPFRNKKGSYVVYADVAETEALFVRVRPSLVALWLENRGHSLPAWSDETTARISIAGSAEVPRAGDDLAAETVGSALLTLLHSYSHRLIRRAAVFAGIDRNALAELLVPTHCGFFIYAAARGDFVLGGLQAVFETELADLLRDVTAADHRCPLDPGCKRAGGACMACLHLGEPSCRYYNRYLDRRCLSGTDGFLDLAKA